MRAIPPGRTGRAPMEGYLSLHREAPAYRLDEPYRVSRCCAVTRHRFTPHVCPRAAGHLLPCAIALAAPAEENPQAGQDIFRQRQGGWVLCRPGLLEAWDV